MTQSTHLALPYIDAAQAQKHVTHNEALQLLDALVHLSVSARDQAAPPASPTEGQRFLVGAGASGAFAGKDFQIATFLAGAWVFLIPRAGWRVYVETETLLLVYDGASWKDVGLSLRALQNLTLLGVGATADATNPLSAKLNNALFTAMTVAEGGTGDLRVILNKESAAKTVSYLFQTGFSGRAEIGLTGDDKLHFNVSAVGASFVEAMTIVSNGFVGVGTVAPLGRLHVRGGTNSNLLQRQAFNYGSGASIWSVNDANDTLLPLEFAGNPIYFFGGNVGIGALLPSAPLHVVGAIRIEPVTVGTLPAAAVVGAGSRHFVTDALAPVIGAAVVGGGAREISVEVGNGVWKCANV